MNTTTTDTACSAYHTYRGLPPVAGLCSMPEAARPGLCVETCVARLKRYHYAFKRLHHLLTARITAEPIMELKTAFSHHAYLCSEHVQMLADRVGEMRQPPLGLRKVPHPALAVFFDELLGAPTPELLVGVYEKALPALAAAIDAHRRQTNPLTDAPSVRVLRFIRMEVDDMIAFGREAVACLVDDARRRAMSSWVALLDDCLAAAGGLDGADEPVEIELERRYSATPYTYDPTPRRDERFTDLWNQGVNAEAFLHDAAMPVNAKILMLLFKRLRELDVPEMMASIITQTEGQPWAYYRDMSRQLWDEARHAIMGEVGFAALGVDWTPCALTHSFSYRLNRELEPLERHAVLWGIEQGLMSKDGKRYEWEVSEQSDVPLAATIQDYDWADEVLHAQIGRRWYVKAVGGRDPAKAHLGAVQAQIGSSWHRVKDEGLTEHANWWPALYRQACAAQGWPMDARAAAFNLSYRKPTAADGSGASDVPDAHDVPRQMHSG